MCSWERFCTFAREPERRKVGLDARVSVDGVNHEVDPDLAEETVVRWWGLFDSELYVEFRDKRYGPYQPVGGSIPLGRYRAYKKKPSSKGERDQAYRIGQKPVENEIIDAVLAKDINAIEPQLTRHGDNTKVLAELLDTAC